MKRITILLFLLFLIGFAAAPACAPRKQLLEFGYNIFSQFGEDGIIQKIFSIIGTQSKLTVEFGAWDGFHFSNTAALWSTDILWRTVLIEGDIKRFDELQKNTSRLINVQTINAWVGIDENDCLEAILEKNGITQPIDLLSIDIDGNDYHIFKSLKKIRPRLIVIEYNPTIPVEYDLYAPYSPDNNFGQSVAALTRIAHAKGYRLVALTCTNAFYILEQDFDKFAEFETDPRLINVNDGYITLVTTYDGKYALIKNNKHVYYYGIDEQFKGALQGDCMRCDTQPLSLIAGQPAAYKK